jgi:hypothetical protein
MHICGHPFHGVDENLFYRTRFPRDDDIWAETGFRIARADDHNDLAQDF